jgi:hypothetical protein
MTTWQYIRELFKPGDRIAICWKMHTEPAFHQRFLSAHAAAKDPYQRFLRAMNAQGNNIYIGMNPLRPSSRSRTKADISEVRHVYLDLDHSAETNLEALLRSTTVPKPNFVLNTSPGKYQVIWRVKGLQSNDGESLMRALARQHSGDPATVDISRVLRLPGLHNKKYDATFQITARKLTCAIYSPQDFPAFNLPPTSLAGTRSASKLTNTPSHHDWAYVCHALWGARDPGAVRATLTDELMRRALARNKPKPRYYAELTFEKAAAYIASKRDFSR